MRFNGMCVSFKGPNEILHILQANSCVRNVHLSQSGSLTFALLFERLSDGAIERAKQLFVKFNFHVSTIDAARCCYCSCIEFEISVKDDCIDKKRSKINIRDSNIFFTTNP